MDCLSIYFAEHDIESSDNSDGVGQHVATRDFVHSRQVGETGSFDFTTVWF